MRVQVCFEFPPQESRASRPAEEAFYDNERYRICRLLEVVSPSLLGTKLKRGEGHGGCSTMLAPCDLLPSCHMYAKLKSWHAYGSNRIGRHQVHIKPAPPFSPFLAFLPTTLLQCLRICIFSERRTWYLYQSSLLRGPNKTTTR